jgi:adenylate cyclase
MHPLIKELLISVIYWTLITILIVSARFVGLVFFYDVPEDMHLSLVYLVSLPGGILAGLILGFVEFFMQKVKSKRKTSFGALIASRTLVYIILFIITAFLVSWLGSGSLELAVQYMTSSFLIVNFILFSIAGFLFHFFKQMNKKFGPGIMVDYLTGKYFSPIEEERIFIFLDLKSSTAIAERLSHVHYSTLIQDCFRELTVPLIESKGEIYQYVGDEVIVTWQKEVGLTDNRCLKFFYDYVDRLANKKDFYVKTYGVFPVFKAGMSLGLVTAAEVGEIKTEIAFHGDVLNTTARIQGLCNKFDKLLLTSEDFVMELKDQKQFEFELVGEVELRGKEGKHKIYCCEKIATSQI